MINVDFQLTDHDGASVSPATYRGRWLLIFFGFTHCRVVCPRNLAKLSAVLDELGAAAENVVPLYISVDPERDTPERMRTWLNTNYPRFTGLTGERPAIDAVRASFRVFAQRRELTDGSVGYDVPHSALTFLVDPEGAYRTHFSEVLEAPAIVVRMKQELFTESLNA